MFTILVKIYVQVELLELLVFENKEWRIRQNTINSRSASRKKSVQHCVEDLSLRFLCGSF